MKHALLLALGVAASCGEPAPPPAVIESGLLTGCLRGAGRDAGGAVRPALLVAGDPFAEVGGAEDAGAIVVLDAATGERVRHVTPELGERHFGGPFVVVRLDGELGVVDASSLARGSLAVYALERPGLLARTPAPLEVAQDARVELLPVHDARGAPSDALLVRVEDRLVRTRADASERYEVACAPDALVAPARDHDGDGSRDFVVATCERVVVRSSVDLAVLRTLEPQIHGFGQVTAVVDLSDVAAGEARVLVAAHSRTGASGRDLGGWINERAGLFVVRASGGPTTAPRLSLFDDVRATWADRYDGGADLGDVVALWTSIGFLVLLDAQSLALLHAEHYEDLFASTLGCPRDVVVVERGGRRLLMAVTGPERGFDQPCVLWALDLATRAVVAPFGDG